MKKVELLAPAGNLERLKIALLYGADAVYFGGRNYSLRANAKNLDLNEINLNSAVDMSIFLSKNQELLSKYYENHRNEAMKYYASITSNSEREIIFDIGYNGSISNYMNKIIDKIYFRQNPQNNH